jgi:hypothetical protein
MPEPSKALMALGFTELEARIYTFLLQESPATGYRIAQAIQKPVANTWLPPFERQGVTGAGHGAVRYEILL